MANPFDILTLLRGAGVNTDDWPAIVLYIGRQAIPRDRREGWLTLAAAAKSRVPTIGEIEQVRASPSP